MRSEKILSRHKLRKTALREDMIGFFMDHQNTAFSEQDINERFGSSVDRVSVYRTIRTFLDKSIIHKIACQDGVLRYAFTTGKEPNTSHPHFECTSCHSVSCIGGQEIHKVSVPRGYSTKEVLYLIQGLCPKCKAN